MIPNFEMIFFLIVLKSCSEGGKKKKPSYISGTSLTFKYLQKKKNI